MQAHLLTARHRAAFFQQLAAQGTGEGQWDEMFRLLEQGQNAAKRAQLETLAEQFQGGQEVLLAALRDCGQFLDWELQFIQLGLATANLRAIYQRLAQHYLYMQEFTVTLRRQLPWPLGLLLVCSALLPALGFWLMRINVWQALGLAVLPPLLLYSGWQAGQWLLHLYQQGRLGPRWVDAWYRLPGIGPMAAIYQTYHYFANLTLCISGGAALAQALPLAARCLPYSPYKRRFQRLNDAVANGAKLSEALRHSGVLAGITLPPIAPGATAQDAQMYLTKAAKAAFLLQMNYWGHWLPHVVLVLLPLILAVDFWLIF